MASQSAIVAHYHSRFPGEDFLAAELPDYEVERSKIVRHVVVAVVMFIVVLPLLLATRRVKVAKASSTDENGAISDSAKIEQSAKDAQTPTRRGKKRNGKKSKEIQSAQAPQENGTAAKEEEETAVEFNSTISNFLTFTCILVVFGILFFSDNQLFTARTVVMAPVLTREECQHVIDMANAAAERNARRAAKERTDLLVEHPEFMELEMDTEPDEGNSTGTDPHIATLTKVDSMLKEPRGWTKDRHHYYPTTDLNLVTDPFTDEDRAWLAEKLNGRLTPAVDRAFGIFRGAIRANDIFVVRYDATKGQANLRKHTDSSHISFNILLNDEFEGGGTRFHSRADKSHFDVNPDVGEALISHAEILHEGLSNTKGTRYILVGFDAIDERDPFTGESTSLSIFSCWLNFSWMQIRFKEGFNDGRKSRSRILNNEGDEFAGKWQYSRYAVSLFRDLDRGMTMLLDQFAKHRSLKMVETKDFGPYIRAMDNAAQLRKQVEAHHGVVAPSRSVGYASWYTGHRWMSMCLGISRRKDKEDKFRGENL